MGSRRVQAIAVSCAIALLALAGCKGNSTPTTTPSGNGGGVPGLTAKTITVGQIADLTGPVPGLFQGAVEGAKAYYAYVNSTGGVNGRTIVDNVMDSALSCSTATQDATALAPKVFALVSSFALFDSCITPVMARNPAVPYVAIDIDSHLGALPNSYSAEPTPPGWVTGAFKYIKKTYGASRMGFLAGAGSQQAIETDQYQAAESSGVTIAYKRFVGNTELDFTADVVRMRHANVDWVDAGDMSVAQIAHLVEDMASQNFHPKVIQIGTGYTKQLFAAFSSPALANGILIDQSIARYQGEDAASIPAVKTFDTWMAKTAPKFQPDIYSLYGWANAELFVSALKKAGTSPTQAAVLAALKATTTFNASGLISPDSPGAKKPSVCFLLLQIENQKFNRVFPKSGFSCADAGFDYAKQ